MEERRSGRAGTVSGLGLLAGGTAVTAVAGSHSVFSIGLLGLLTLGLGHSLAVEIRRQAHRRSPDGWSRHDSVNAVLLGVWAEAAMLIAILGTGDAAVQAVGAALAVAYAAACAYFVTERRRAIATQLAAARPEPDPAAGPAGSPRETAAARPKPDQATPPTGARLDAAAQPAAAQPTTAQPAGSRPATAQPSRATAKIGTKAPAHGPAEPR